MKKILIFAGLVFVPTSLFAYEVRANNGSVEFAKYTNGSEIVWSEQKKTDLLVKYATNTAGGFVDIAPDAETIQIASVLQSEGLENFKNIKQEIERRKTLDYKMEKIIEAEKAIMAIERLQISNPELNFNAKKIDAESSRDIFITKAK